jgi:hypothetical protein
MRIITSDGRTIDKFEEVLKVLEIVLQKFQRTHGSVEDTVRSKAKIGAIKQSVDIQILSDGLKPNGAIKRNLSTRQVRKQNTPRTVVTYENMQQSLLKLSNLHWQGKVWSMHNIDGVTGEFRKIFVEILTHIVHLREDAVGKTELRTRIQWREMSDILQWVDSVIKTTKCVDRQSQIRVQMADRELKKEK